MSNVSRLLRALLLFAVGVAVSAALVWWLMRKKEESEHAVRVPPRRPADVNIPVPLPPIVEPEGPAAATGGRKASAGGDDLTRIDGIGPKYAAGLRALGITTYAQLAQQDPVELSMRLKEQGVRIVGDSIRDRDWIGQARKLAAGDGGE